LYAAARLQAFAQVMLLQQEAMAGLMGMLEDAKAEAAATLAPITRPPSPRKRQALQGEQEAAGRVREDRWADRQWEQQQQCASTPCTVRPPPRLRCCSLLAKREVEAPINSAGRL
jgi:hypothetical protein